MNAPTRVAPLNSRRRLKSIARQLQATNPETRGELMALANELFDLADELPEPSDEPADQPLPSAKPEPGNEARDQVLLESVPDGHLIIDRTGVIREADRGAVGLLGAPCEFLIGKPLTYFLALDRRSDLYQSLNHPQSGGERWESVLLTPSGLLRPVEMTLTAADPRSGIDSFRCVLRDISERKSAERALNQERLLADSLFDSVQEYILVVDDRSRVVRANSYFQTVGVSPEQARGQDWCTLLLASDDRLRGRTLVYQALAGESPRGVVLPVRTSDGRQRAVAWSARALFDTPGGVHVVLLGLDVTELHDAQQRALQSERLAAIGQTVTGLAHEGRNCLQRIQSCISMLEFRLQGQPETLDIVRRLQRAQDDLSQLFETLREYAAPIRLCLSDCHLDDIWREAWTDLNVAPGSGELIEVTDGTSLLCMVSPFHLKQVFRNLFENALSAAPSPVRISVRAASAELAGLDAISITVTDNGPGFAPEVVSKAFQPFVTTKIKGTGLGLAICKRLIETHGGRIELDAAGTGGQVKLIIPRKPQ